MDASAKPLSPAVRADLAARFTDQGRHVYGTPNDNSSPLYAWLSLAVADDPAMLALVAEADRATLVRVAPLWPLKIPHSRSRRSIW